MRNRHKSPNPHAAVRRIQQAVVASNRDGVGYALVNDRRSLVVVLPGIWHCSDCKNFMIGEPSASEKCPECESK